MHSKQQIARAIVVIFAVLVVVGLFNPMEFSIEAFQFKIRLELFDHGMTVISLPPLGSISAKTHHMPVQIHITLERIDLDLLGKILEDTKEKQQLIALVKAEMEGILRYYVLRLFLLSFLGGIGGALLLHYNRPFAYLRAGLVGMTVMMLLLVGIYTTYQAERFSSPQFDGVLKAAPWMVGLAEEALAQVQDLSGKMQIMASNLYVMFERINTLEPLGSINGDIKILHVSDIHNHPAAFDIIKRVAEDFAVNFVIDTGDLSDFGTVMEGLLTDELAALPVPYVFIPGNHDSPAIVEALQKYPNVFILDEEIIELDGIKVFGLADPASYGFQLITTLEEKYFGHTESIKEMLERLQADIIAVHRPSQARNLAGLAPIILHGHDHRQQIQVYKDSFLIDAGTTGAAGIRRLQVLNEIPYTLVLLHINKEEERWVPKAADVITLSDQTGKISMERILLVN